MKSLLLLMQCLSPVSKILAEEETLFFQQLRALICDPWKRYFRPKESIAQNLADLRLLTCHHNGYLREKAIQDLAKRQDTMGLNEFFTCVNDWVPQVHHAATAAVRALLIDENATAFIAHLPQVRHLLSCKRYDHTPLVGEISQFLTRPEHLPVLCQALHCADHAVSEAALCTLIEQDKLTDEATLLQALRHHNARLRAMALSGWLKRDKPLSETLILRLLRDRWPRIRQDTLFYLHRRQHPLPESLHTVLLLDKNGIVQQRARLMLTDLMKAIPFWLQVVTTPIWSTAQRCRALHGLKEAHYHELYSLALWGYDHSNRGIRMVSLQILLMQEGEESKAYALSALADPVLSFVMGTIKQLRFTTVAFSADDIDSLLANSPSAKHTFLYCRLMRQLNKWDWLILLLRYLPLLPPMQQAEELAAWKGKYNQAGINPTSAQQEILAELLAQSPALRKAVQNYLV